MTITTANIDIGDLPNDGTGDPLRTAFDKINLNFAELELLAPDGPNGSFQFNANGVPLGTANFAYVSSNNTIQLGANIIPTGTVSIGSTANAISNLYVGQTGLRIGNIKVTESANVLSFPINVLPTSKASLAVNNITADGNLIGSSLVTANTTIVDVVVSTTSNVANQVIFEVPATSFKSGLFQVKSNESSSNNSQYATISVNKSPDNNGVRYSVYGTVFVGNVVTNYNVDVGFDNVRLMVSPYPNLEVLHTVAYQITG